MYASQRKRTLRLMHINTHTSTHTHAQALVKVTMLHETKGQMVDNDTVPALARWLKYAFPLVRMNVALHISRRWKSLNFTHVCFNEAGRWIVSGPLACFSSPEANQGALPEDSSKYLT